MLRGDLELEEEAIPSGQEITEATQPGEPKGQEIREGIMSRLLSVVPEVLVDEEQDLSLLAAGP